MRPIRTLVMVVAGLWCLGQASPAPRSPESAIDIANRYIEAYLSLDQEALAPFFTEESVWCDPTSKEIGARGTPETGGEKILQRLKQETQGLIECHLDVEEQFASGGYVVTRGAFGYRMVGDLFGRPGEDFEVNMSLVMVLRIDGDKVLEHTDYTDFSDYREQIRRQLR